MTLDDQLELCKHLHAVKLYQPVILTPGVTEISGKWNEETKELANDLIPYLTGKSILDIGCNTGFFLFEAMRNGARRACGVDNDQHVIELAKRIQAMTDIPVEFELSAIESYMPDAHFDVILMMNVFDFIEDPQKNFDRYLEQTDLMIVEHEKSHDILMHHIIEQRNSHRGLSRILSFASTKMQKIL